jgi:hypothetical protein
MAAQNPSLSLQPHQLKIVDIFRYEYGNASLDEKLIQYAPEESVSSRFSRIQVRSATLSNLSG